MNDFLDFNLIEHFSEKIKEGETDKVIKELNSLTKKESMLYSSHIVLSLLIDHNEQCIEFLLSLEKNLIDTTTLN